MDSVESRGCIGRGIANGVALRARANAAVRSAEARLASYVECAENRNRRELLGIVASQNQLNQREQKRQLAAAVLLQCRSQVTDTQVGYTVPNWCYRNISHRLTLVPIYILSCYV